MGRIIAVTSGKGGVGKTTLACFISEGLSRLGRRVAAVDGDMGLRNLDIMFGVQNSIVYDAGDVIERRCKLEEALVQTPAGPQYLAAANQVLGQSGLEMFRRVILALKPYFDYVIVDCAAGIGQLTLASALCADEVIVVTTPEETAIRDAERMSVALHRGGMKNQRLIVNRINPKFIRWGKAPDIDSIIDSVAVRLLGIVPVEPMLPVLQNRGESIFDSDYKNAARQLADICLRLDGTYMPLRKIR